MLQLEDALTVATTDNGPKDALQHALEWRLEVKQLLAMIAKCAKKIKKQTLPDKAIFYVSGGHHESYGSTGHPYDILAVTDDATDVAFFSHRKCMNAAFKVQYFKDVIKLVGSSVWTANPTEEQHRLTLLVLHDMGEGEPWLLLAMFGHTSITLY